jgi:ABC-type branched-subunit amino acid transport system permease subunit
VRAIFFAMVTLAVASAFAILAAQLSSFTGGEDGRSFRVPELLRPGTTLVELPFLGPITGRIITYYVVFLSALALFLGALRIVNSPFGRVLQAIRENDFRAKGLPHGRLPHIGQLPRNGHRRPELPAGAAPKATEALPLLADLLHPDRWLLWLGVLFVLSVYFFPTGIVGKLRQG